MFQFFKKIFSNRHTPEERQKLAEKDTLEYQKIHESDKHPAIKHFLKSIHLTKWLVKLFIPDFLVGHPSLFDNLKIIHQEPKFKPMRMAMGAFFIFLFLFQFGLAIFNIITAPKMHADAIHWPLTTATDYSYDNTK
ncbi:MAG: hypothetical protein NT091_05385, partial [Candidatus Falkowbacteria bacterium]|nr:hypothetical protein [Candidatus Falkowbacteria bacterium]